MRRVGAPGHQAASYGICQISSTLSGFERRKKKRRVRRRRRKRRLYVRRVGTPGTRQPAMVFVKFLVLSVGLRGGRRRGG